MCLASRVANWGSLVAYLHLLSPVICTMLHIKDLVKWSGVWVKWSTYRVFLKIHDGQNLKQHFMLSSEWNRSEALTILSQWQINTISDSEHPWWRRPSLAHVVQISWSHIPSELFHLLISNFQPVLFTTTMHAMPASISHHWLQTEEKAKCWQWNFLISQSH